MYPLRDHVYARRGVVSSVDFVLAFALVLRASFRPLAIAVKSLHIPDISIEIRVIMSFGYEGAVSEDVELLHEIHVASMVFPELVREIHQDLVNGLPIVCGSGMLIADVGDFLDKLFRLLTSVFCYELLHDSPEELHIVMILHEHEGRVGIFPSHSHADTQFVEDSDRHHLGGISHDRYERKCAVEVVISSLVDDRLHGGTVPRFVVVSHRAIP